MKLIFDQNISHKVISKIEAIFPDSTHVRFVGLLDTKDDLIFRYAKSNLFDLIVTMDSDFVDILFRLQSPPKVVWIRNGNISTNDVAKLLIANKATFSYFLESHEHDIFQLFN
jgi:predicted nuclease of predicted toxin-antitoxin system